MSWSPRECAVASGPLALMEFVTDEVSSDLAGFCPHNVGPPACYAGPKWTPNDPLFFLHHAVCVTSTARFIAYLTIRLCRWSIRSGLTGRTKVPRTNILMEEAPWGCLEPTLRSSGLSRPAFLHT